MEVQTGPDGNVDIIEQHQQQMQQTIPVEPPQINGHPDGQEPVITVEQPPPPKPRLYDMDLERVHVELYRNKYLTPSDFLHSIRKIVHNAEVCAIDDLERLHKAQAMLTATEVSLNDFDQAFRLECERMAVRERKRRDDRKKQREKEKAEKAEKEREAQANEAADSNNPYAPGTRRSARNNGQEPEVAITDPLQLERRLKRGRSAEGNFPDGRQSSEETGEGRSPKRSRVASEDEQQASQSLSTQFMKSVTPTPEGTLQPPQHDAQLMHPSPRRTGGFNPSLLNPAPMPDGIGFHLNGTPSASVQNGVTPPPPSTLSSTPTFPMQQRLESPNPFIIAPQQPQQEVPVAPPHTVDQQPNGTGPEEQQDVSRSECGPPAEPDAPEPMEVARTPTPLPDFHIDEYSVEQLKDYLRVSTAELNIEELEQLRATCLAAVWRHRTEWDRISLVEELLSIAKEFVQEVLVEDVEMSP